MTGAAKYNKRNEMMCARLNDYLDSFDIHIDYENDVVPLSEKIDGGAVTERHICLALVHKLKEKLKSSTKIIAFLIEKLNIPISKLEEKRILDENTEELDTKRILAHKEIAGQGISFSLDNNSSIVTEKNLDISFKESILG